MKKYLKKYIKLAKESFSVGDRIQAEYYNQFADHYSRLMTESGVKPIENNKDVEDLNYQEPKDVVREIDENSNMDSVVLKNNDIALIMRIILIKPKKTSFSICFVELSVNKKENNR